MSNSLTGLVQEVNNFGMAKGSNIVVDGNKYGCYDPVKTGIDILNVGDEVQFDWAQKGKYVNIMGRVNKTGNTGTPAPAPASAPKAAAKGGWGGKGVFPIPATDGQRSIIRQNSVTNAVKLFECTTAESGLDPMVAAQNVIEIAQVFEEYSSGDLDEAMAKAAIEALQQPEQ